MIAISARPERKARSAMHSLTSHLSVPNISAQNGLQIAGLARLRARQAEQHTEDCERRARTTDTVQPVPIPASQPAQSHDSAGEIPPPNRMPSPQELRSMKLKNRLEAERISASEKAIQQAEAKIKLQARLIAEQEAAKAREAARTSARTALEAKLLLEKAAERTQRRILLEARLKIAREAESAQVGTTEDEDNLAKEKELRKLVANKGKILAA